MSRSAVSAAGYEGRALPAAGALVRRPQTGSWAVRVTTQGAYLRPLKEGPFSARGGRRKTGAAYRKSIVAPHHTREG